MLATSYYTLLAMYLCKYFTTIVAMIAITHRVFELYMYACMVLIIEMR